VLQSPRQCYKGLEASYIQVTGSILHKSCETFAAVAMASQFNHFCGFEVFKARNTFPGQVSSIKMKEVGE
jgi:hypothetical protein